ncbi:MAG: response regulator [Devosiaceae bacterium]|nr:response regulator [Devosiaceae bacterium MH13]
MSANSPKGPVSAGPRGSSAEPSGLAPFEAIAAKASGRGRAPVGSHPKPSSATARDQASNADDAVRLIGAVSHEMRNPLNGILGMAHLLADTKLDAAQRSYLDAISASGDILLTLVNDLLDLTALRSGSVHIQRAPCDVDQLINQTLELTAPDAHARGLALASHVDPALSVPLPLDGGRVRQILSNLISNALKFTEQGGVRVDAALVFARARADDGFAALSSALKLADPAPDGAADETITKPAQEALLVIDVTDTGAGVRPTEQALIFQPFGRTADAHLTGTEGTGLGLPLSRGLAEAMGGTLELVHSAPGEGTHMRLTIPLDDCALPLAPASGPLDGRRILIAMQGDENGLPSVEAEALADTLVELGAHVRQTTDPATLNGPPHNIDHVLVDTRFDHALLWARLCLPGTGVRPIVLMRTDERGQLADLQQAGFGGYLLRPVRRASLLALLTDSFGADPETSFRTDPADFSGQEAISGSVAKRILLADDSEVNALLVRATLERAGHTVMVVHDGARAIAMAQDASGSPFDVVLLDLSMPVLDGFAAARQIRAQGFEGRILALSGNSDPALQSKLDRAGFDGFAQKPVTPDDLIAMVEEPKGADTLR